MKDFLLLLRPKQWIKNVFVLIPALFAFAPLQKKLLGGILWAFISFCLFSSAVYVLNDLLDRKADALHPRKRHRPLASGRISPVSGALFGFAVLSGAVLTAWSINISVALIGISYFLVNMVYSYYAKYVPILDVFFIASGFILRVYAGGSAAGVPISPWLMLNTLFLSLFLGFGKRRSELIHLADGAALHRKVLEAYSEEMLNYFLLTSCSMVLVCYSLYTIDPVTVQNVGSRNLLYTVPIAAYGLFRYLFLLFRQREDRDIAEVILADRGLLATCLLWGAAVVFVMLDKA